MKPRSFHCPLGTGESSSLLFLPSPSLSLSLSANSLEFLISKFIMSSWSRTKGDDHVAGEDEGDTLRQWRHKVYSCTKNTHLMEDARSSSSRRWAAGEQPRAGWRLSERVMSSCSSRRTLTHFPFPLPLTALI